MSYKAHLNSRIHRHRAVTQLGATQPPTSVSTNPLNDEVYNQYRIARKRDFHFRHGLICCSYGLWIPSVHRIWRFYHRIESLRSCIITNGYNLECKQKIQTAKCGLTMRAPDWW